MQQHELFPESPPELKLRENALEPRLWVRRIMLTDGDDVIRNIELKPGLNVIWSPDSAGEAERIGHGGGKTTLCRLIRYCLGEKSYGPHEQALAIGSRFPNARVLAEVRLNSVTWLINRPLGAARGDFALLGEDVANFQFPDTPTGIQVFRDTAAAAFLGDAASLLPSSIPPSERWLALLAWLTRDQECRFSHLLDWRSPESASQSPISGRNRSQDDRLATLRVALAMLGPDEIDATQRRNEVSSQLTHNRSELTKVTWHIARLKRGVLARLGDDGQDDISRLQLEELERRTSENLAKVRADDDGKSAARLREAMTAFQDAAIELGKLEGKASGIDSDIALRSLEAKVAGDEIPGLTSKKLMASTPLCPVCDVPIDQVLAEGCGISLSPCDLSEVSARIEDARARQQAALSEVNALHQQKNGLGYQIAAATQATNRARETQERLEREAGQRSELLRLAERAADIVQDLKNEMDEADRLNDRVTTLEQDYEDLSTTLAEHRLQADQVVKMVSDRFSTIFSQLVKTTGRSSVRLDGNGLHVKASGDGTAIASFAVVLFDLAALTLAMEGKTNHPDFLLHDSPREADLGRSLYSEIFKFAESLEEIGPSPLFQYIITTTTEPPERYRSPTWLRLQLQGAPEAERLFRVNL